PCTPPGYSPRPKRPRRGRHDLNRACLSTAAVMRAVNGNRVAKKGSRRWRLLRAALPAAVAATGRRRLSKTVYSAPTFLFNKVDGDKRIQPAFLASWRLP